MSNSETLKTALATELNKQLAEGEVRIDKDGNQVRCSPKPALMTVVLNFLKEYPPSDNGLPTAVATSDRLANAAKGMPFGRKAPSH